MLVSQGQSVAEAMRSISVKHFTYYRWRKECGGPDEALDLMKTYPADRMEIVQEVNGKKTWVEREKPTKPAFSLTVRLPVVEKY